MPVYQQQIPVEYGDVVTVNKYQDSDAVYIDIETNEDVDIRFVRLTQDQAADLIMGLLSALREIAVEQEVKG